MPTHPPVRAGAVQLNSTEDTDRNLETANRLVREAAAMGADLVVLPEKWTVLGTPEQMNAGAESLDGRFMELGALHCAPARNRSGGGIDGRAR